MEYLMTSSRIDELKALPTLGLRLVGECTPLHMNLIQDLINLIDNIYGKVNILEPTPAPSLSTVVSVALNNVPA